MKKIVLKKWVVYTLSIINIILFVLLASDYDNTKVFIVSKMIELPIFMLNSWILIKYSGIEEL